MVKKAIIFSDGSSRGNPGPGGWGSIVLFDGKVAELGGREDHTTNNRMELLASIEALGLLNNIAKGQAEVIVNSDSSYVINGITKWIYGWQKNGWKTGEKGEVANRDLWEKLIEVAGINPKANKNTFDGARKIKWNYVGGHIGVPGNERCDEIATAFADKDEIELFKGKLSDYKIDLFAMNGCQIRITGKSNKKKPAYSYVSLVNGVLNIDKTWAECEKRVKGVKGDVKYKKATSEENEREILKSFEK